MTEENAIELLNNLIGMVEDNHNSDYDSALKMGIKALKQNVCRKRVMCQGCQYFCPYEGCVLR